MVKFGRCCCFTIETGGVIIATLNVVQILLYIFYLLTYIIYITNPDPAKLFGGFIAVVISIVIFCITIFSIKGIDTRNHSFILPMLIWMSIELVVQLITSAIGLLYLSLHGRLGLLFPILLIFTVIFTALKVLSFLTFYSLFILFKKESKRGRNGQQQYLPTTEKVESDLEDCS